MARCSFARWGASAALVATLGLPTRDAAALPEPCQFGVNAHQAPNDALDKVAAAGIGWVRFDMNWLQFEPAPDSYDWTIADRFIDHATSIGLHVFVTVAYSPSWAVLQPCNDADPNPVNTCLNRPPLSTDDWTDFLSEAVLRYQDRVTHWGMWNEPNLEHFFLGSRDTYVSTILVPGSNAVHAVCPSCKVLGPELANLRNASWDADEGTCIGDECIFNGWNYSLIKVLEVAAGSIDVVTHHRYQRPASDFWVAAVDGQATAGVKYIDGLKEITDQHAPGKPVWLTELGIQGEPFGDATNAEVATEIALYYQGFEDIVAGSFSGAQNQPWPELEKLFWYDLTDDPNGYSWGLLDADGAIKPQYTAYQDIVQALGGCNDGSGAGGQGGASDSSSATGQGGGTTSGAGASAPGSGAGGAAADESGGGCSCAVPGGLRRDAAAPGLALALALLSQRRRRAAAR